MLYNQSLTLDHRLHTAHELRTHFDTECIHLIWSAQEKGFRLLSLRWLFSSNWTCFTLWDDPDLDESEIQTVKLTYFTCCCVSGVCISQVFREQERLLQYMKWCAVCSTRPTWTRSLLSTSSRSTGWRWRILIRPTSRSCRWEVMEAGRKYVFKITLIHQCCTVLHKLTVQFHLGRNWQVRRPQPTTLPLCWRRDSVTLHPGRRPPCCWWTK